MKKQKEISIEVIYSKIPSQFAKMLLRFIHTLSFPAYDNTDEMILNHTLILTGVCYL